MRVRERTRVAQAEILRRCTADLDVRSVQEQVLRSLRRVLAVDAAFSATAHPGTLLITGALAEEPLDAAATLFLDNELRGQDVNTFPGLATGPRRVSTLDIATRGDRRSSARYRDIMRPLGLGDELRAALTTGPDCWGYLCLHREESARGFSPAEVAAVAQLAPHIGHVLRRAALGAAVGPDGADDEPGVVLLTGDLELVAITPAAEHLLALAEPFPWRLPLPLGVRAAAAALRTSAEDADLLGSGAAPRVPATRVPLAGGGWLTAHASWLRGPAGDPQISVVLQRARPEDTVPLLLAAYGLTSREAEVARLVLRGASTEAIVDDLHISRWTVQQHLTAVFDKVGVRSRRQLAGRLMAGPAS